MSSSQQLQSMVLRLPSRNLLKLSQSDFPNMFVTHILISNKHFPLTIIKGLLKVMMNKIRKDDFSLWEVHIKKILTYLLTYLIEK